MKECDAKTQDGFVDELCVVNSCVRYQLLTDNARPPFRNGDVNDKLATPNVGLDLFVSEVEKIAYDTDGVAVSCVVKTGVVMAAPPGYSILLAPRSSLAKSGWYIANTLGIIDNPYRGELLVMLARLPGWGIQRKAVSYKVMSADGEVVTITSMEQITEGSESCTRMPAIPKVGERTAQAIIVKDYILPLVKSEGPLRDEPTGRGSKGFGSSGK